MEHKWNTRRSQFGEGEDGARVQRVDAAAGVRNHGPQLASLDCVLSEQPRTAVS